MWATLTLTLTRNKFVWATLTPTLTKNKFVWATLTLTLTRNKFVLTRNKFVSTKNKWPHFYCLWPLRKRWCSTPIYFELQSSRLLDWIMITTDIIMLYQEVFNCVLSICLACRSTLRLIFWTTALGALGRMTPKTLPMKGYKKRFPSAFSQCISLVEQHEIHCCPCLLRWSVELDAFDL